MDGVTGQPDAASAEGIGDGQPPLLDVHAVLERRMPPGPRVGTILGETVRSRLAAGWTSLDEEEEWNPVIALPGRSNLGSGRHWHFLTVQFWILTGGVYVLAVFASGYWRYLIPTDWAIFPQAVRDIGTYLHFQLALQLPGEPFGAAQKLAYCAVVFVLAPLQIASGAAMSPAVLARFPWYGKLFGGKQGVRSVPFLGLCAFAGFVVVQVLMVIVHGIPSDRQPDPSHTGHHAAAPRI
ncbi:cytochrome b/b6 domain-containing protein [Nocardia mikamii]|uniref:cytochrome b/b6 domain-containing protein n=1 Tax=Nocardia mikamii TaxID=508464 RepID=UPI000A04D727